MTIQEVAKRLDKSEKTIRRWIKQGKLYAELVDGKYVIDESELGDYLNEADLSTQESEMSTQTNVEFPMQQIEYFKNHVEELRQELAQERERSEQASQRHDTIVLQLTRQLEQSQRLLEYHQEPWYRKLFRRKRRED